MLDDGDIQTNQSVSYDSLAASRGSVSLYLRDLKTPGENSISGL